MKKVALLLSIVLFFAVPILNGQTEDLKGTLEKHVYTLSSDEYLGREAGSREAYMAAEYIAAEFENIGLEPGIVRDGERSYMQNFRFDNRKCCNVVGFIPGNDPELREEYIVIGAHYDHIGSKISGDDTIIYHGADDNASGTAMLIELARILKQREDELQRTVIFAAFDAEEVGLGGSQAAVKNMDAQNVRFMINMDMVGWLDDKGTLEINGVSTLDNGRKTIGVIPCPQGLQVKLNNRNNTAFTASDHDSFRYNKIPAIHVTTGKRSPYHKSEDTADKINYEGMELITGYMADMSVAFADMEEIEPAGPGKLSAGIAASIGSGYAMFRKNAVQGRAATSFNAGAFLQYNFNEYIALRPEVQYTYFQARYPHANASGELIINNSYRWTHSQAITVPVNILISPDFTDETHTYIGFGPYYSYVFDAGINRTPLKNHNMHEWGISMNIGLEIEHVGIAFTGYFSLTPISKEDTVKAYRNSCFFTVYYRF